MAATQLNVPSKHLRTTSSLVYVPFILSSPYTNGISYFHKQNLLSTFSVHLVSTPTYLRTHIFMASLTTPPHLLLHLECGSLPTIYRPIASLGPLMLRRASIWVLPSTTIAATEYILFIHKQSVFAKQLNGSFMVPSPFPRPRQMNFFALLSPTYKPPSNKLIPNNYHICPLLAFASCNILRRFLPTPSHLQGWSLPHPIP